MLPSIWVAVAVLSGLTSAVTFWADPIQIHTVKCWDLSPAQLGSRLPVAPALSTSCNNTRC